MSTPNDNTQRDNEQHDERAEAVRQADAGTQAWRAAVHAQQAATPDHADFYALAGPMVDTVYAVRAVARVVSWQVAGYPEHLDAGRRVYDDTRTADPRERLIGAAFDLDRAVDLLDLAAQEVNRFWSAIGHIGVEDVTS